MFNKVGDFYKKESFVKNILFYSILTSIILFIHLLHVYLHFSHDVWLCVKLSCCAFFEACLEGMTICLIGSFLSRFMFISQLYILIVGFIPVFHLIDFILERMFNLSFWHTATSFFSESLANMLELLYATNFSIMAWIIGALTLVGLAFLFVCFYKMTEKRVTYQFRPLHGFVISVFGFLLISVYFPLKLSLKEDGSLHLHEKKVLPFKHLFAGHSSLTSSINFDQKNSPFIFSDLKYDSSHLFLFIVESLRDDSIHDKSAPYLTNLGKEFYRHPFCIANANGTHLSWFSLFHSQPAIFWKNFENKGSPFLEKLKGQGYQIKVLSSARLSYYGMDKTIFKKDLSLQDEYFCPRLQNPLTPYEADKACFDYLKSQVATQDQKTAYIIFLDASHFGYSLPKNAEILFQPHAYEVPYLAAAFSKMDITQVKNRYLNTIHALDQLFGDFFDSLKQKKVFDPALIMVTADHGEEFFEKGQLFHASHLSSEQLRIPFILKAPANTEKNYFFDKTLSHQDMLPLLDAVLTNQPFYEKPFQMAARYNFSQTPNEVVFMSNYFKELYFLNSSKQEMTLRSVLNVYDVPLSKEESRSYLRNKL